MRVEKSGTRQPEIVTADTGETYDPLDATPKGSDDTEVVEQLRPLETRLDDAKQFPLKREKVSEAQYQPERERIHPETLRNKLHDLSDSMTVHPTSSEVVLPPKLQPLEPKLTKTTTSNVDIFENCSDDENPGGLFEILQEIPATETTASGSTVRLQSMAIPNHWSHRLPKAILQEMVAKKDKYAVAKYACISGPSRVQRASVTITWDGGRTQSWSMDDVGCPDLKQAEEYVSTVSLHALTFPTLDGFALGGTSAASTQTFFRRLPPAFRNLWDELEAKRKESDDATNRVTWEKLRTIVRVKLESQSKVPFLGCYFGPYLTRYAVDREAIESRWRRERREDHAKYVLSGD